MAAKPKPAAKSTNSDSPLPAPRSPFPGPRRLGRPAGFTLFEVILAIALAAVLLTLIGTAINLYLVQVDAGRTRVEEAQLARSILSMIADDIRATTIYKPQDTSSIAQLMAQTAKYTVDDIDKAISAGGVGKASALTAMSSGTSMGAASALSPAGSSSGSTDSADTDTSLPLGINGSLEELYVDATRLPKQEELFSTATGYSNAQSPVANGSAPGGGGAANGGSGQSATATGGVPATDLKTVHYFIRPGAAIETGSASVTTLDPAAQAQIGGLVRQEIPRAMRNFAEKNGGSNVLDSNQVLLAPEVVHIEFHFFDGSQVADTWDMKELKKLPVAVEVRIWMRPTNDTSEPVNTSYDLATLSSTTHEYRQVVNLPMAQLANAAQSSSSSTTDSMGATDTSATETSTGDSAFNQAE
jgi:prepilin-type N-terminal cleavage/methylation domain-containing protein